MVFPSIDEMAKDVANKALDEFVYNDKTIREWANTILYEHAVAVEELEKINEEIKEFAYLFDDLSPDKELVVDLDNIEEVINRRISKLKGENE